MSSSVKLGLGLLGLLAVIVPGSWMIISAEPASTTALDASSEYKGKFGEDFRHHLVDAKEGKNQGWWNWSFRYRWKADEDIEKGDWFKGIKDGSLLRQKCEEMYKKETNSLVNNEGALWRYCSLEGIKPATVKDLKSEYGDADAEIMGKKYEADLVSVEFSGNNRFWDIQEEAFFGENGLGKQATEGSIFHDLYKNQKGTLRSKCQEAYKKKESEDTKDKKDVFVFCSLKQKRD